MYSGGTKTEGTLDTFTSFSLVAVVGGLGARGGEGGGVGGGAAGGWEWRWEEGWEWGWWEEEGRGRWGRGRWWGRGGWWRRGGGS